MNSSDYRFDAACRYHDAGNTAAAIDQLTELLADNPDVAIYHGLLASCLLSQNRFVAAEYENQIALRLDPAQPYLFQIQARLLIFKRKLDEAMAACDEALRLEPASASSFLLKATIFRLQGLRDEEKSCLDQAAHLKPGDIEVEVALGDYYSGIGKYDLALEHARQALSVNAQDAAANILMGEVQLARGNAEEADYHAKFAITQNPYSGAALRLFANIRMRNNWFIGAWWRFNNWIATLGTRKSALVLIGGYLGFNTFSEISRDLGYPTIAAFLAYAWLIIVLYSWVGLPVYRRAMDRELQKFRFNPKF